MSGSFLIPWKLFLPYRRREKQKGPSPELFELTEAGFEPPRLCDHETTNLERVTS